MKRWMLAIGLLASFCHPSADRDLPPSYREIEIPPGLLASKEAPVRGAALFAANCALCHGARGDGHGMRSAALSTNPRDFTDPTWQGRTSTLHIFHAIREGVPETAMPAWKSLTPDQCWDLVAYVRLLAVSRAEARESAR